VVLIALRGFTASRHAKVTGSIPVWAIFFLPLVRLIDSEWTVSLTLAMLNEQELHREFDYVLPRYLHVQLVVFAAVNYLHPGLAVRQRSLAALTQARFFRFCFWC
jgi:hypothetical protein